MDAPRPAPCGPSARQSLMVSRNLRKWGACVWAWNAASSLYTSYVAGAAPSPGMIGAGDFMAWSSFGSAVALCPDGRACGHSPHGATLALDPQRRKRKFSPCRLWLVAGAQAGYNPPHSLRDAEATGKEAHHDHGLQYLSRDGGLGRLAQSGCGEVMGSPSFPLSSE